MIHEYLHITIRISTNRPFSAMRVAICSQVHKYLNTEVMFVCSPLSNPTTDLKRSRQDVIHSFVQLFELKLKVYIFPIVLKVCVNFRTVLKVSVLFCESCKIFFSFFFYWRQNCLWMVTNFSLVGFPDNYQWQESFLSSAFRPFRTSGYSLCPQWPLRASRAAHVFSFG